jgi:putative membrane protein
VKFFGLQLVQDHRIALQNLRGIARDYVPATVTVETAHQHAQQLSGMRGSQFDRAFVPAMIAAHEQAITRFEQQARSGNSSVLRDHAQGQLPTLRRHLQIARDLATFVR